MRILVKDIDAAVVRRPIIEVLARTYTLLVVEPVLRQPERPLCAFKDALVCPRASALRVFEVLIWIVRDVFKERGFIVLAVSQYNARAEPVQNLVPVLNILVELRFQRDSRLVYGFI